MTVVVDGRHLTLAETVRVARQDEEVELSSQARARMERSRALVEASLVGEQEVYGLTTGVGERKRIRVSAGESADAGRLMIDSHRVGLGPIAARDAVRATMLRLLNAFAGATTAARPELADVVVRSLNEGLAPDIRTLGSIGQADLAPMADLAHGLLASSGLDLAPAEGLALINSNAFSTALAALAISDARELLDTLDVAGSLDLEAFRANPSTLRPEVGEARPYPGLRAALDRLRSLLEGSSLWDEPPRNLQDPLTFRCLPQVLGAARDGLAFATAQVEIELNAAQGNPLVSLEPAAIFSVGNFDVLPLAAALDFARIAMAPTLSSAAERVVKLLNPAMSGLPSGLTVREGLAEDGLAIFGVSSQAIAAEALALAQPVSFELVSTTQEASIEDRMTMAPLAARRLSEMVGLGSHLVAIELAVAAQAIDLRKPARLGTGTGRAQARVREIVPFADEGMGAPQEIGALAQAVRLGDLGSRLG